MDHLLYVSMGKKFCRMELDCLGTGELSGVYM